MGKIAINNEIFGSEYASDIKYDNTNSKAESENIQDVIDEIFENGVGGSSSNNIYIGTDLEENPNATLFIKTDEDYETFPGGTNGGKSNYHKFSTEEQVVGEWINGDKIYEKTFYFEDPLSIGGSGWTYVADVPYMKKLIQSFNSIGYGGGKADYGLRTEEYWKIVNSKLYIWSTYALVLESVVLHYTKNTD